MFFAEAANSAGATGAAVAALIAALGYVSKMVIETYIQAAQKRRERFARLIRLSSLLDASWTAFENQRDIRNRLFKSLNANHPDKIPANFGKHFGYEQVFSDAYDVFTPEEKKLHTIIRGITTSALRPVNLALSEWLSEDTDFRTGAFKKDDELYQKLSIQLNMAARHLVLWNAKYRIWIKDPKHALVYLDDEEHHGLGFPAGIEDLVREIIKRQKFVLPELIKPKKSED
jgi:hypothetical protein